MKQKTYIRTEEVKSKQSEAMIQLHASGNFNQEKRVETYKFTINEKKARGENVGRKSKESGGVYKKNGDFKLCPVCSIPVYHTPKQILDSTVKCCSRKCLFKDETYRNKLRNINRDYMQTEEYKSKKLNPNTPAYTKYARKVRHFTELNYVLYHDLINPNNYPRTLCGVKGGYQLDHIKSIKECWNEGISPEKSADPGNLQIITWQKNLNKRKFDPIL